MKKVLREMATVADYLWHKGWAERNAGNMSVIVTEKLKPKQAGTKQTFVELQAAYPGLEGQFLLISGSGTRMRELARKPRKNTCLIKIEKEGKGYVLFNGEDESLVPSSELHTHLSIHEKLILDGRSEQALLHTHVSELIALTQIPDFKDEANINSLLWGMHPETVLFIPDGAGFVPYTLPGTTKIAQKTLEALDKHRVIIWEKHGCLAVGKNLYEAFDQIDILAKSANIFFTCKKAGYSPEGMTEQQLNDIRDSILKT